jgi:Rrf2 family nitric oxide-sensitive transcriptional repressor
MRLTSFSDYAMRLLMFAAAQDRQITIEEVAQVFDISRNHLMKIATALTRAGYLKAVRGRSGGLILGKLPENIRLSDVVRATEPDFAIVECFSTDSQCVITRSCRLKPIIHEALDAFTATLDHYTLADLMLQPRDFRALNATI